MNNGDLEDWNNKFVLKNIEVKNIFIKALNLYNTEFCQCAYPRFQQIVGIDCRDFGESFKCFDTDLLIDIVKPSFYSEKSTLTDECTNEKWICKKCGSTYEYGWSDFSIAVDRKKLKLVKLNIIPQGKMTIKPIPIFIGLYGYSYPARTEINSVTLTEFEEYMTER